MPAPDQRISRRRGNRLNWFPMGKYKAAKGKKKKESSRGAIPCLILLITGISLFSLLFYLVVSSQ